VAAITPMGELHIHNRNGAIELTVPQGAGFQLQATAKNGNIDSKLNLPVSDAGGGQSASGQVGAGGPRIELVADHGDITIGGMEAPPPPPAIPAPPSPPAPPGAKSLRHLRPSKDGEAAPVTQ